MSGARELIELTLDAGSWRSWDRAPVQPDGYAAELAAARDKSGCDEAVVTGEGSLAGRRVALVVSEFRFLAGSIGVATADRIVAAVERATAEGLPLLAAPSSGGTRMQEGTVAFVQMARITAAVMAHRQARLPYLVYLRHPTTGGVLASWGSLGHVTAAEPGALIGFLGPRVHEALHGEPFPSGVQTAENLAARGLVDAVVPPSALRAVAAQVLDVLLPPFADAEPPAIGKPNITESEARASDQYALAAHERASTADLTAAEEPSAPQTDATEPNDAASRKTEAAGPNGTGEDERSRLAASASGKTGAVEPGPSPSRRGGLEPVGAWEAVERTRAEGRPGVRELLREGARDVTMLSGTGAGENEPGLLLALARFGTARCVLVGQDRRGQRSGRAIGPAGLRVARRGMRLAAGLRLPLLTVVDTPGAMLSAEAENGGLAGEIARCLADLITLDTPTVCLLLGEGSGGAALALLPADRVLCARDGWLSPLPPEGASVIVHRTTSRAPELAASQGIGPADLLSHGIADQLVDPDPATLAPALESAIQTASSLPAPTRLTRRSTRFRPS